MNADSSDTPVLLHPGAASTPNLVNVNEEDDDDVECDVDASALDSRLLMPGAVESPYLINDEQPSGSGEISTVSAFPATPAPPQVWTQRLLNKPSRTPASASLQRFAFSIAESMSTPNGNVNAAAAASSFRFLAEQNNDDAAVDTARKVSEHPTVSAVSSPLRHLDVSAIERISPPLDAPSEIVAGNRDDDNGDDSVVVNDRSLLEAMGVEEESAVNAANQFPGNQLGATTQPSVRRTLFPTNVTMRRRVDAAAEEEHGNSNTVLATPQQTGKQRVDVLEAYGEAVSQEKTSPTSKVVS